jgi:ATP/maltotriose-dependent transcriptional regulator MalT
MRRLSGEAGRGSAGQGARIVVLTAPSGTGKTTATASKENKPNDVIRWLVT